MQAQAWQAMRAARDEIGHCWQTQGSRTPSDLRADKMESISSMKITAGCKAPATANRARTIFSPSPIHLEVREEAEMLKKVALILLAIALPMSVLPASKPLSRCQDACMSLLQSETFNLPWRLMCPAAVAAMECPYGCMLQTYTKSHEQKACCKE